MGKVRFEGTNKAYVTVAGKEYEVGIIFDKKGKVSEIAFGHPLSRRTVTRLQVEILYALRDEIARW